MIRTLDVKLVTPAIIGGANPRACDPSLTLRPPELRGLFRFWTRALGGPGFRPLETSLWGTVDTGQRVTLRVAPLGQAALRNPNAWLFPRHDEGHRAPTEMIAIGASFRLTFNLRNVPAAELPRLQAVVWTALHLGALGRRSRRGYGSLDWIPSTNDLLSGFLEEPPTNHLANVTALADYLRRGLARVQAVLGDPAIGTGPTITPRTAATWFRLRTIDQVFVGRSIANRYDGTAAGMEHLMHGLGTRGVPPPESDQLGSAQPDRLASPMLWRVYQLTNGSYVPVMTWSPYNGVTSIPALTLMHGYLATDLGFTTSLAGAPL